MATHDLELYVLNGCPYCRKVLGYMKENGIDIPTHEVSGDPAARAYLLEKGGKVQAPCLFIDGSPLYESDDIIAWLSANA